MTICDPRGPLHPDSFTPLLRYYKTSRLHVPGRGRLRQEILSELTLVSQQHKKLFLSGDIAISNGGIVETHCPYEDGAFLALEPA